MINLRCLNNSFEFFASQDCMYLHELGEEAASFTKEEMQQGYVFTMLMKKKNLLMISIQGRSFKE